MIVTSSQENKKRIVTAPRANLSLNSNHINIPSNVMSVELDENESVEWIWTTYPNGQRIVTGYNVIKNS